MDILAKSVDYKRSFVLGPLWGKVRSINDIEERKKGYRFKKSKVVIERLCIIATVTVTDEYYSHLINNFMANHIVLADIWNKGILLYGLDNNSRPCIRVKPKGNRVGVLLNFEGYDWVRYATLKKDTKADLKINAMC